MKHIKPYIAASCLLLGGAIHHSSQAESAITKNPHFGDKGWDISLGLGVFSASDSLYQRDDDDNQKGVFIPLELTFYGDNFHFTLDENEGLLLGYTVMKNEDWAIDAILSPRFVGPEDNDLLDHLDDRDPDLHAGLRYTFYHNKNRLQLEVSQDISDTHDGYILSASYEKEWQARNWLFTGGITAAYISEKMTDYYFNVSDAEATVQFPAYNADDTTLAVVEIRAEYPINEHWVFNTHLAVLKFGEEVLDSPISSDKSSLSVITTDISYHF